MNSTNKLDFNCECLKSDYCQKEQQKELEIKLHKKKGSIVLSQNIEQISENPHDELFDTDRLQ